MTSNALTYKIMPVEKTAQEWRNWQTRRLQVPVTARPCGFKSHLLHKRRGCRWHPLLLCRSDLEPVGSRSPRRKRLVGPLGGKKVHRTFFFFRLAPSPAYRRILEPVGKCLKWSLGTESRGQKIYKWSLNSVPRGHFSHYYSDK